MVSTYGKDNCIDSSGNGEGNKDCEEIKIGGGIKVGEETIQSDKVDCKETKIGGEIEECEEKKDCEQIKDREDTNVWEVTKSGEEIYECEEMKDCEEI